MCTHSPDHDLVNARHITCTSSTQLEPDARLAHLQRPVGSPREDKQQAICSGQLVSSPADLVECNDARALVLSAQCYLGLEFHLRQPANTRWEQEHASCEKGKRGGGSETRLSDEEE